jgi:hypothetical protein
MRHCGSPPGVGVNGSITWKRGEQGGCHLAGAAGRIVVFRGVIAAVKGRRPSVGWPGCGSATTAMVD